MTADDVEIVRSSAVIDRRYRGRTGTNLCMKPKKRNQSQEKPRIDQYYRLAPWKICIGLGVLILIFFAKSFTAALLFDSESIIKFDPRIRTVNRVNVEQILTRDYWFPTQESVLYRPLT